MVAEDDFFDYLIGITSNKDLIQPVVRRARTDSALLFLGFQLDDWDFRVLFRSIMGQEGRTRASATPTSRADQSGGGAHPGARAGAGATSSPTSRTPM